MSSLAEKVYLHNDYFIDDKRPDKRVSAILVYELGLKRGRRPNSHDTVELIADTREELDMLVAVWAAKNASNYEQLVGAGEVSA